jgi:hypothetical protein
MISHFKKQSPTSSSLVFKIATYELNVKDNMMIFNEKEWIKIYMSVRRMGKMLKESRPSLDEHMKSIPALHPIPEEMQRELEKGIKRLLTKSNFILDGCGLTPYKPLWKYSNDDVRTWPSHHLFIYKHLLKEQSKS